MMFGKILVKKGKMVILRLKVGRDGSWGISDIPVKPEWSNYERIESQKFSAGFREKVVFLPDLWSENFSGEFYCFIALKLDVL